MAETFVPLIPQTGSKSENIVAPSGFRAIVRSGMGQPLPSERKSFVIENRPLEMPGKPQGEVPHLHRPTVTVEKEGDVITYLRVTCGCGEIIEVQCSY
ncbi:MAG: hypothetical protein SFY81_09130 [Verrucomicrobiota bacterium]|nr:hypothetical protein [Verrucomicrobiota bacterium]